MIPTTYFDPHLPMDDEVVLYVNAMPLSICYILMANLVEHCPLVMNKQTSQEVFRSEIWYGTLIFWLIKDRSECYINNVDFISFVNRKYSRLDVYGDDTFLEEKISLMSFTKTLAGVIS